MDHFIISFDFEVSCNVRLTTWLLRHRCAASSGKSSVSRVDNSVSARPFAGDPPAVWPIDHLRDAPGRAHRDGESHIGLPNNI
jgi:hypothetical protein